MGSLLVPPVWYPFQAPCREKKPRNMDSASQHPRAVLSLTVSRASSCLTEVVKVLYHAVGSQQISAPRPLPLAPSGIRGARSVQPVPVFHPIDTGWLGVRNEVGFRSDVSRATCIGDQPDSRRTWLAVQFTSGRSGALWLHSSRAMLGPSSHRRTCELETAAFIGGCVSGIHSWTKATHSRLPTYGWLSRISHAMTWRHA